MEPRHLQQAETTQFTIPRDADLYIENIHRRCAGLIDATIWEGLELSRFNRWLKNFKTPLEHYFAACLLDALIYRSRSQTVALMEHMFQRTLTDMVTWSPEIAAPAQTPEQDLLSHLRARVLHTQLLSIVPVIKNTDSPAKSGPLICRFLRRYLHISDSRMNWPWAIPATVTTVIFVDDFLGTGDQFIEFAEHFNLKGLMDTAKCIYAPLTAHDTGVSALKMRFPRLSIASVEKLNNKYNIFSADELWFKDRLNTAQGALEFYEQLARTNNLPQLHGHGNLGLAYAFQHGTPDNTLPIFWYSTTQWHPLLER